MCGVIRHIQTNETELVGGGDLDLITLTFRPCCNLTKGCNKINEYCILFCGYI